MQTAETSDPTFPPQAHVVSAAQAIFNCYHQTHGDKQLPAGVAIDRETLRGHVCFQPQPILLPRECFVSSHDFSPTANSA